MGSHSLRERVWDDTENEREGREARGEIGTFGFLCMTGEIQGKGVRLQTRGHWVAGKEGRGIK